DEVVKGGKQKKRTETGRITLHIPNKGEDSAAGGDIEEAVQPSPKKRKGPNVHKGRTMTLLSSSTVPAGDLDCSDKNIPAADADLGVVPPPSSH
ncbi:hypothetical protein A2U01_0076969, partial [Trifolium medium]|nr:hypothetical protein [Trifolium medium]